MATIFEPKRDQAEWRYIYNLFAGKPIGHTVTYDELSAAIERAFLDNRTPIYRAQQELESAHQRTLACVRNVGYRIVEANEHEGLARHHHKKSRRQLKKASRRLSSADRSALTTEEAQRVDRLESTVARHSDLLRRLDRRTETLETAVDAKADAAATEDRLSRIEDLLRRDGKS